MKDKDKIQVLIIDDESISVRMIKNLIPWDELDLELLGSAFDGVEALSLIGEKDNLIILCDIRMPGMDGLAFASVLKNMNRNIQIIFISAYTDYEYMKKALKLKCCNYILKPVDEKELEDSLVSASCEIEKNRSSISDSIRKTRADAISQLRRYIKGEIALEEAETAISGLNLGLSNSLLMGIDTYDSQVTEESVSQELDSFRDYATFTFIEEAEGCLIYLLSALRTSQFMVLAGEIRAQLLGKHSAEISISVSSKGGIGDLNAAYGEIKDIVRLQVFLGEAGILGPETGSLEENMKYLLSEYLNTMESAAFRNDWVTYENIIREVLSYPKTISVGLLPLFYDFAYSALLGLRAFVSRAKREKEFVSLFTDTYEDIAKIRTLESLKKYLLSLADPFIPSHVRPVTNTTVEKGLRFLQENYDKALSLESFCDNLGVSKNYFCYLFKKETGCNIWSYLTRIRMARSGTLLKETDLKNYEIAYKVGYDNPSYFCKLFRKEI